MLFKHIAEGKRRTVISIRDPLSRPISRLKLEYGDRISSGGTDDVKYFSASICSHMNINRKVTAIGGIEIDVDNYLRVPGNRSR